MTAQLPTLPASYKFGAASPHLESQQIEYKRSTTSRKKFIQTLCGFLNTNGGYLIFGIEDDLSVIGLCQRHVDQIARSVDDIIRDNTIINITRDEPIHRTELTTVLIPVDGVDRTVVAVRAVAQAAGSMYSLATGERVYRLNASNHVLRGPATEYERLNCRVVELMTEIAKVKKYNSILSDRLADCDAVVQALHDRILAEKDAAEARLGTSWTKCLLKALCGFSW